LTGVQITTSPIDVCLPPFDITFSLPVQTGIADPPVAGAAAMLGDAFPNPFRPATTIPFTLAREARATVAVYDALGRRVRTLANGLRPSGPQTLEWDGRGDTGGALPSGVYFIRLETGGTSAVRKVVLLR
jgi:hypothetical protein